MLFGALSVAERAFGDQAVLHIDGVASKKLARDIEKALPEGVEATPSPDVDVSLKKALRKKPLGHIEDVPGDDDAIVKATRKALAASRRDWAVIIAVGKARNIRVLVVPADEGRPIFFRSMTLPHFESADEHVAWWADLFKEAIATKKKEPKASPPEPEPEPPPKKQPEKARPETPPDGKRVARADYFLSLGADVALRQFSDIESGAGPARSYRAFPMPGFHVAAELYPIANGHIGFEGDYAMSLGVHSKSSDGQTVGTTFLRTGGALKFRLLTAKREQSPWIALLLGYGYSRFTFDDSPPDRELPTAVYQMLRAGLDGRAPIDRVVLSLGAEYDRLFSIARLGTVTPAPSGNGVTARAGIGFEVTPDFFVRLDARYTWLSFGLSRDVPSNIVDQYLTGSLAGELTF